MTTREILKKVRQIEIRTRGLVNEVFSGEYHSVFRGRGMEFSEVREYQVGDDIRSIDWNVTARFDHPFVKIFEEERELTVILAVDMSGSQKFGSGKYTKQQIAAEISAILAFSSLKNNDKVGLILFSDKVEKYIPPKKAKSHTLRIIRDLLSFEPSGKGTNIKSALEFLNRMQSKRAIVFLLSDFNDSGYETILKVVGKRHDLVGVMIEDDKENEIPAVGLLRVIDPENGNFITLDTSSAAFSEWYKAKRSKHTGERKNLFLRSKIDSISVNTKESYIKPLVNFFKMRESRW